jgi:hypothetical protein
MNPEDFATVAEEIVKGGTPAHCRTAIGRAYYSAFTTAFILLKQDVRFPKTGDKHTKVRLYLANCGHPLMQKVSSQLGELKDKRTQADYEMEATEVEDPQTAELQVEISKRLNANLRSVLGGPERQRIVAEIAKYKQLINDVR